MRYSGDSAQIADHIKKGAKYLIILGEEPLKDDYLKGFLNKQIGQYNNVRIFDLR